MVLNSCKYVYQVQMHAIGDNITNKLANLAIYG